MRGCSCCEVSDAAKELIGPDVVEKLNKAKTSSESTGAFDSDAHGKVENIIAPFRWALDRVQAEEGKPRNAKEWRKVCREMENDCRNTILLAGYSSSQRATGRGKLGPLP